MGRFILRTKLGSGGFGVVYLAEDPLLKRSVAIKLPHFGKQEPSSEQEMFVREARAVASLKHPGLASIYDVGMDQGHPFLVMEYIDGISLSDLLRGKPGVQRCIEICIQVAEAVGFAHMHSIVHRDLKPSNILIDRDNLVRVTDFGLALSIREPLPRRGDLSGTPYYMAPEQVRGETHLIDGRADIWALGVILYRMLAGKLPFRGTTIASTFEAIEQDDPRPIRQLQPKIPRELERICGICLSKSIRERYATMTDLIDDLKSVSLVNGIISLPPKAGPPKAGETPQESSTKQAVDETSTRTNPGVGRENLSPDSFLNDSSEPPGKHESDTRKRTRFDADHYAIEGPAVIRGG